MKKLYFIFLAFTFIIDGAQAFIYKNGFYIKCVK